MLLKLSLTSNTSIMKLSDFKKNLAGKESLEFIRPDGRPVAAHFHITEAGLTTKHFIDCGGTIRKESVVNFQLYLADDIHHRLSASKLEGIIRKSESVLPLEDHEIEVEYMTDTIGRYGLECNEGKFLLTAKKTDCLAKDNCGITPEKTKLSLSLIGEEPAACCSPGKGCC
jgi:hypothetical protein